MGSCIICGTSVDGHICRSHQEDVVFVFEGDRPGQLTPGRYYRGTVDGYADFGVFVDIGDSVTGLLHKSELDTRLEGLDWEPGDTVFVQVTDVRDNGNVDLGWSIRQGEREFRGTLIDAPGGDRLPDDDAEDEEGNGRPASADTDERAADADETRATTDAEPATEPEPESAAEAGAEADAEAETDTGAGTDADAELESDAEPEPTTTDADAEDATEASAGELQERQAAGASGEAGGAAVAMEEPRADPARVTVETLDDRVGDVVRLEGEVISVRQTSGPTIFELRDETAAVECAAFKEAGVRAYPEIEVDDYVRLEGEVERRRGQLQVETEALVELDDEDGEAVARRLEDAMNAEASPDDESLLAEHAPVAAVAEAVTETATAIRRAVMEGRPVVVRHTATADGYVAGAAIERAVLPLVKEEHAREDAQYHFFERRPLGDPVYDMDAATDDATNMLEARDRHGEQFPLLVLVDAGSTRESVDGFGLLDVYGVDRVVVDANHPDPETADHVSTLCNPHLADVDEEVSTTALAANVAAQVNDDVREDIAHLPAVSYWEDTPDVYAALATDAGVDADTARELHEAVALEAYYQSYSDKRELISDVLFSPDRDLASHVSEQFRVKLDTELETATNNLSVKTARDTAFAVLDTDQFTHRFDFPSTDLLLDALHRDQRDQEDGDLVTLGVGDDELHLRSTAALDVREIGAAVQESEPEAGVRVVGGRDGKLEFLTGERADVLDATVAAVADALN